MVSLFGLHVDIRMYICIDRRCCRVHVWSYISERNDLVMIILLCLTVRFFVVGEKWLYYDGRNFYLFCFNFHMEVTCSHRVLHLWYRGNNPSWENLYHKKIIKEKQLSCENIFIVCLLLLGEWPSRESLLHAFNNLHVCLTFNCCSVYHLLGTPYEC